jgi:hypothetical protein
MLLKNLYVSLEIPMSFERMCTEPTLRIQIAVEDENRMCDAFTNLHNSASQAHIVDVSGAIDNLNFKLEEDTNITVHCDTHKIKRSCLSIIAWLRCSCCVFQMPSCMILFSILCETRWPLLRTHRLTVCRRPLNWSLTKLRQSKFVPVLK